MIINFFIDKHRITINILWYRFWIHIGLIGAFRGKKCMHLNQVKEANQAQMWVAFKSYKKILMLVF